MRQAATNFNNFLGYFPELELPVTLNDEIHLVFSSKNQALSQAAIREFILPFDQSKDDLTEFIACFKIPQTHDFHAIVYWKAELMNYNYVLATFTKEGLPIDVKVIAGTFSDGKQLTTSIATIDEDWMIFIVSGQTDHSSSEYDAASSKTHQLELLPDGTIQNVNQ